MEFKFLSKDGLSYVWGKLKTLLEGKVDKREGYGLSKNDLTDELKQKILDAGSSSFTGDYNDLTSIPTLDGTQIKGTLTSEGLGLAKAEDIPTDTGDLTNEAGFITMSEVEGKGYQTAANVTSTIESALEGYATEDYVDEKVEEATADMATQTWVSGQISTATNDMATNTSVDSKIEEAISGVTQFDYEIVETLPEEGEKGTIYLKAVEGPESQNIYEEFLWLNDKWEMMGTTSIDLSGYVQKDDLEEISTEEIDEIFKA